MTESEAVDWIIKELQGKLKIAEQQLRVYEDREENFTLSPESRSIANAKVRMFKAQILFNTEKLIAFLKVASLVEEAIKEEAKVLN